MEDKKLTPLFVHPINFIFGAAKVVGLLRQEEQEGPATLEKKV